MSEAQLVVQLPVSASTDFDELIDIENSLTLAFLKDRIATVEGHTLAGSAFNIFIVPRDRETIVARVKAVLADSGVLDEAIIATRSSAKGPCSIVWPEGYSGTIEI